MINIFIFIFLLAFFWGAMEANSEGAYGWAENFPTTRYSNWFIQLCIGKEITAYHINMLIITLIIFHIYFLTNYWCIGKELICLGLMSFYLVLEDFLFFVINRHFGIKKFHKVFIAWHKRWFLWLPSSYWVGLIISSVLIYLGFKITFIK
jgi:hypothetical protein